MKSRFKWSQYKSISTIEMEQKLFEDLEGTATFVNKLPQDYLGPIIKCLVIRIKEAESRIIKLESVIEREKPLPKVEK